MEAGAEEPEDVDVTDLSQISQIAVGVGSGVFWRYALAYTSFFIIPAGIFWLVNLGSNRDFITKCGQLKQLKDKLPTDQIIKLIPPPYQLLARAISLAIDIGPGPLIFATCQISVLLSAMGIAVLMVYAFFFFTVDYCKAASHINECISIFGWKAMLNILKDIYG